MDYQQLDDGSCDSGDLQDGNVALSDVIEVIATDPDFRQRTETKNPEMFNGGGEIPVPQPIKSSIQARKQAYVKIVEQPASKALRFRYECEGRSAGSIPGARSTPETKTYPTVQIVGYQGRAVVVVSCVTKDAPHKPHPYKLVSKSNNKDCRDGIFQTEVNVKGPFHLVDLKNVGIQCVKRRRMANSLKLREELKIDPFNTGFSHRNQPTSIDLNTVRLCFQVFLEGDTPRKFSVPLTPVVSEPIYDKKAMSDLSITKLSDCVSYVDGGRKDMILLCEKVAKEDIQVRFFEDPGDWEAYADFQPSQVHKQHAIWFRTPRYKTLDVTEPVKVFIQLKRPSDGAVSEPLPFELWPLDSGRPPYWSFKRKKSNYSLFNDILARDAKRQLATLSETNNNQHIEPDYSEIKKAKVVEEKSFNELINQVAELDEIYTETQARLLNELETPSAKTFSEQFDDAKTYSSLQLAFKNPLEIDLTATEPDPAATKREIESEKPPLPPKRTKKIETYIGGSIPSLAPSNSTLVSRTNSFTIQRPKSQTELTSPAKQLPPTPNYSTLPNPKKKGFFSKLFSRHKPTSRESSVTPSTKSLLQINEPLTKSSGNLSTHSANSVRIPLKDSPPSSPSLTVAVQPLTDDVDMTLDLTEAEHYALYTAIAPHATQSEFDDMSCYYAPVEGDPGANKRKRQKMENPEQIIRNLQGPNIAGPSQFVGASFTINQIKSEPRGSPSPYGGSVSSYGGVSPMYNIAASPQSQTMWESPSPVMMGAPGATGQPNQQFWLNIPVVPPTVNLPAVPPVAPATDLMEQSNNEIFNLDSGEIEKFVHRAYDLQDIQDPLPNLDNMSLSDMNINSEMTDSLTNFTNRAAEACGLMDVNKLS